MKVLAALATGFEDLEAIGTIALLRRSGIKVDLCSVENRDYVVGKFETKVSSDQKLETIKELEYDCLFIPGGNPGVQNLYQSKSFKQLVNRFFKSNKMIAAICAGPSIPGRLGLLDGLNITCYPGFEEECIGINYTNEAVTVDQNVITGKGAGTVHEFAATIISEVLGKDKRDDILKQIYFEK